VAQAVEVVRPSAEAAGVWVVAGPAPGEVLADPDRVVQVLVNLLSNAVKFSPAGGTVWLEAERRGAESRPGAGSTLSFTLPAADQSPS
jgi:signal transduction histidine kinase